ncbi:ABC transporter permease [Pedobacter sp. L105]|uniref:ABC transporter permease n=1 Tax=Pedobacter sp. L105 TaxID=1641871 RepID=UPI00131D94C4|nr:ABC transporter permease [Pedobacter sp. L105]
MFRLNLKIAWRNLWKNKGYTLINILGLATGMASCMLIFLFIHYQMSFDEGYKNENRIYRFVTDWKYPGLEDHTEGVPIPLVAAARNDFPGLEKVAAIQRKWEIIHINDENGKEKIKTEETVFYAEPDFFDIFNLSWLSGKTQQTLNEPNTAVLSETMARKLFGTIENAAGKSLLCANGKNLKVTGVFKDMPENSSFPLNIVISYQTLNNKKFTHWDSVSSENECYVLAKQGVSLNNLQASMLQFNKKYYQQKSIAGNQSNRLQPLRDIHYNGHYGNFAGLSIAKKEMYGLTIIGLFLILTACINFINLATAQAVNRSKEVGIRKVMGSQRKQLVIQFLMETFVVSILALLISCVLTELAIPGMQHLFSGHISFNLFGQPVIFIFMTALVILVSFLAGFYPAMIISGFSPVLAIKNKVAVNAGGLNLRKVLVVVQFTITIVLIISTLVIVKQMQYVNEKSLGFNGNSVAMVSIPGDSLSKNKYNTFKERALQIPGVQLLSFCQNAPQSENMNTTKFIYNGHRNNDFEVRISKEDENYFKLFDVKLIAGKVFMKSDTARGCVVNETFLKKMNIANPEEAIGKMLNPLTEIGRNVQIVGVVKDFNDLSLKDNISPMGIYAEKSSYNNVAIRIDDKELIPAMKKIEVLWNNTFPAYVYHFNFVNDHTNSFYEGERITGVLFRVFAGVIIFISFTGLFGLISFVANQRTREVAIRKVLGASTLELIKMLNGSFLLLVFLANLVAWPLAYLFVSKWLSGFAYRISLNVWPFALAFFISMLLTLITVSIRSYKAAHANTIDSLKYE